MTKEALRLALEALENSVDLVREDAYNAEELYGNYPARQGKVRGLKVLADDHEKAITAIKDALSGEAQTRSVVKDEPVVWNGGVPAMLPKQKEGETFIVSYEPKLEAKDEPWTQDDMAYRPNGLPQEFIKHEVELPEDWSEWVCPNPDEYFMKCCDCGLVHEVQYRVARYGEGDYCELVDDKDVQAQFRMRRRTQPNPEVKNEKPWVCECGECSYNACKCVFKAALEAKNEPDYKELWQQMCERCDELDKKLAQRKPLTDEEIKRIWESLPFCNGAWETFARAIEAAHGIKGEA